MLGRFLFILFIVFVFGAFLVGGFYLMQKKTEHISKKTSAPYYFQVQARPSVANRSSSSSAFVPPQSGGISVVNAFYTTYFACGERHFHSESTNSLEKDCPTRDTSILSPSFANALSKTDGSSIFCSQDLPSRIVALPAQGDSVEVDEFFGTQEKKVLVDVQQIQEKWIISSIHCPR